jgi:hypothetical protein
VAIDLFCYTAIPPGETRSTLDALVLAQPDLFKTKFTPSEPRTPSALQLEIASEHGVRASSLFLVHLQDKQAAGLIANVAEAIKSAYGAENVLVLFENERAL